MVRPNAGPVWRIRSMEHAWIPADRGIACIKKGSGMTAPLDFMEEVIKNCYSIAGMKPTGKNTYQ